MKRPGKPRRFIQVIAGPRQTGRTTNKRNRYLNAEKHGLIADVENIQDKTATPNRELETKRDEISTMPHRHKGQ